MQKNKPRVVTFNAHRIGTDAGVFIIAEAGVNHNGDLNQALQLIKIAHEAGADAVKFQTFQGPDLATEIGGMAVYQQKNMGQTMTQQQMLKSLALGENYYAQLVKRCRELNILFMSTPQGGFKSVDLLESYNVPVYKIGSGDLTNLPLLTYIAKIGKPIILSTGMSTLTEIQEAASTIENAGNEQIVILHCVSNYPCAESDANLKAISTLMGEFPYPIGFSDHTLGINCSQYAVVLGATVIEKHFTLSRKLPGPDQVNSLEPQELTKMVTHIRSLKHSPQRKRELRAQIPPETLGNGIKEPNQLEREIARQVRKSLVWTKNLHRGHLVTRPDIDIKRPGYGLAPKLLNTIIGKRLQKNVMQDMLIESGEIL